MLRNYFTIAWRNLIRNRGYSAINIGGLSIGMAVALLTGLWVWDELSFNTSFQHYDRIALVKQHLTYNGQTGTQANLPYPTGSALRANYGSYFTRVVTSTSSDPHILSVGDKSFSKTGRYMESEAPELLSLSMRQGTRNGLSEPGSILLAESVAHAYFGDANPVGRLMKIDNRLAVNVTGVYQDFPRNSDFNDVSFIAPWQLYFQDTADINLAAMPDPWDWNGWYTYVQLADRVTIDNASASIQNLILNHSNPEARQFKPTAFLDPMRNWHLYAEFKNGVRVGGLIDYVWLFGAIGTFVLLLACINFMNLSTARSEKRAKEVGIRKSVGSVRSQLVGQFFGESLLIVLAAFGMALLWVVSALHSFNGIVGKQLAMPWLVPGFWLVSIGFILLTALVAGSYPAFYLSSFQPIDVLKGSGAALRARLGRLATLPRKILVVSQFTVSIVLIVGTIVVFRQIQHAKNRPVGYDRNGLLTIRVPDGQVHAHFDVIRTDLQTAGAITDMAETVGPLTDVWATSGNIDWPGKAPGQAADFPNKRVSYDFGKTVGWQFTQGRDFSRQFPSDSSGFILNETAVKFMNLKHPVGQILRWGGRPFKVIGVVKDLIVDSPYQPVRASLYYLADTWSNYVVVRLNPAKSAPESLNHIETAFKKINPAVPFAYSFVDQEYAKKFGEEERIGKLASVFTLLAIFISCLGLLGLVSYVAEQRTKEIGVRKVLGANVLNLWALLSKDFVVLVLIGFVMATLLAHYFLTEWLRKFDYRTPLSWWVFAIAGLGALLITLLTVSFQSIRAALVNPVKSLRSE